jgi:hypothetical protein
MSRTLPSRRTRLFKRRASPRYMLRCAPAKLSHNRRMANQDVASLAHDGACDRGAVADIETDILERLVERWNEATLGGDGQF